jgi:protein gp37
MSENSKIEWTDHTFNPWEGCQKVGPGCDHCYAETRNARFGGGTAINWGAGAPRRRTSAANWRKPLVWSAAHDDFFAQHGRRQRVFCASLADVFDNAVDPAWRDDLFDLIAATPNLDWLLLTKRIGNVGNMLPVPFDFEKQYPNVWLGATITSQAEADRDIPKLLALDAAVRFLSMEPLLGPVDLRNVTVPAEHDQLRQPWDYQGYKFNALQEHDDDRFHQAPATIDWVIVGGVSGPGARPMSPDWARSLRDQCDAAGVPFLFKQWGEWLPAVEGRSITGHTLILEGAAPFTDNPQWYGFDNDQKVARVGKKAAGRLLDGVQHDGFPT